MLDTFIPSAYQTDADMLNAAVRRAAASGRHQLIIPPINPRTGEAGYEIDDTILLPSHIEIILDNCILRLAPGSICNIFRNENMYTPLGGTLEGEQEDISIRGRGHAVLDAGDRADNDIFEWTPKEERSHTILYNNYILFHNVRDFRIENIEVRNQRWWALNFIYCRHGYIADIVSDAKAEFSNQDGINLRTGCHDITIERISGQSGDDLIALTAMGGFTNRMPVAGKSLDLHDVVIRDVIGTSVHEGIVTLRCHDDRKMYNIEIENVIESNFDDENNLPYGTVLLGQNYFFSDHVGRYGDIHDISLRNVYTKSGGSAVTIGTCLIDSVIENIHADNCMNVITTLNYSHEGCTKIVKRGYGDDGIKIHTLAVRDLYVGEGVKDVPIDLTVMREEDFIEGLTIDGILGGSGELIRFDRTKGYDITLDGRKL